MQLFRFALTILMATENQVSDCSKPCDSTQLFKRLEALSEDSQQVLGAAHALHART